MAESKKIIGAIVVSEIELNKLFKEALDGIRDDLNEAQENADAYLESILNTTGGRELWGTPYNDALKIKGQARDRQLKMIDMFKDRVTKKEQIESTTKKESDMSFDHSELNKVLDELAQGKKYENVNPSIDLQKINKIEEKIEETEEDEIYEGDDYIDMSDEDIDEEI